MPPKRRVGGSRRAGLLTSAGVQSPVRGAAEASLDVSARSVGSQPSSPRIDPYWAEHQKMEEMIAAERERSTRGGSDPTPAQQVHSTPKRAPKPAKQAPIPAARQGTAPLPPLLPTPAKIPLSPEATASAYQRAPQPEPEPEPELPEGVPEGPPPGEDEDAELGAMAAAADLTRARTQLLGALSDADWPAAETFCLQTQGLSRAAEESQGYASTCDPGRVLTSANWTTFPLHAALIAGAPPSLLPLILEALSLPRDLLVAAVALLSGDGAAAARAYGNLSGATYTTPVVAEGLERARALSATTVLAKRARQEYDVAGLVEACAQAYAVVPESVVLKGALADAVQSHIQLQQNLPPIRESNGPRQSGATASLLAKLRAEPADHNTNASTSAAELAEGLPGVHGVGELEAEGPVPAAAALDCLDIRAKHERFQSSIGGPEQCYDEAGGSQTQTQRTVAARAELTALTPTVERFFGTKSGLKYTSG